MGRKDTTTPRGQSRTLNRAAALVATARIKVVLPPASATAGDCSFGPEKDQECPKKGRPMPKPQSKRTPMRITDTPNDICAQS